MPSLSTTTETLNIIEAFDRFAVIASELSVRHNGLMHFTRSQSHNNARIRMLMRVCVHPPRYIFGFWKILGDQTCFNKYKVFLLNHIKKVLEKGGEVQAHTIYNLTQHTLAAFLISGPE